MSLEHWDPIRRKYLLYRKAGQHSEDCARYPFEAIPRRIFLDTNVVNRLVRWGEQIFWHEPIPRETDERAALDIDALMHVLYGADRTSMQLVGSIYRLADPIGPVLGP